MENKKIIPLDKLYSLNFELSSFFAQRQVWVDGALFKRETPRSASALIFLSGCTGVYTDLLSGESFFAPCKSLVYLPYNAEYTVLNVDSKIHKPDAYLLEFNMLLDETPFALSAKPFLVENANSYYFENAMREAVACFESAPFSPALIKAKIFNILAQISKESTANSHNAFETILPALEQMDKSPYDATTIEEYAAMCGLSCGGFRRLFKQHMGKSPIQYRISNKLTAACYLLEESNLSIKDISEVLCFESTSYFCRLFKNRIRKTPLEYREYIKKN